MFQKVKLNNNVIGHEAQIENCKVFFGNKNASLQQIQEHFSFNHAYVLEQVHGNKIIKAQTESLPADGHYTSQTNKALFIKTADCIPLMITTEKHVFAIHAGWRSLTADIVGPISSYDQSFENAKAFIGPHIHQKKFEVKQDVIHLFQHFANKYNIADSDYCLQEGDSYFMNLSYLLQRQLIKLGFGEHNIFELDHCTYDDPEYNSYRKDQSTPERQWSFVVKSPD